jgi:hypothetical protein
MKPRCFPLQLNDALSLDFAVELDKKLNGTVGILQLSYIRKYPRETFSEVGVKPLTHR